MNHAAKHTDERGMRRMLTGETMERGESEIIYSPDWVDSGTRNFDGVFFSELAKLDALVKLNEYDSALIPPRDGFRLRLSELQEAGKIRNDFVRVTREFVVALAKRSHGRYEFEMDFIVTPYVVGSHSKGRSGRKQLQIEFDARPPGGMFHRDWGASIGLKFDFRNKKGVITECVNEYEEFYEKVYCVPNLFDATFGSLGGYDGSTESIKEPVNAEKVFQSPVHITQNSLFFGQRLTPDAITAMGSLDGFADECIRVFDLICEAGYYHVHKEIPYRKPKANPSMLFENFVIGKANQLAVSAATQVAEAPNDSHNPLFIYGGGGLGKSHLIQAIANRICINRPQAKVCYLHAERFVSDVIQAYQANKFEEFEQYYRSLDVLLIDDVQFFSGKSKTQEQFFDIFNALVDSHKQIILASDTHPCEMSGIESRLISRFGGGLTVAIEPPDLESRVSILLLKSGDYKIPIVEEVAIFIAEHVTSDIRKQEGALKRVVAFAKFHNRPITIELVKEVLQD